MVLALVTMQSVVALTEEQVLLLTNGCAVATAGAAYLVAKPRTEWSISVVGVTFLGANRLFNWFFNRYTPIKRYTWAQSELTLLADEYLFSQEITQDNLSQILRDSGCEASEIALVTAFLKIQSFDKQLTYIIDELTSGIADTQDSSLSAQMHDVRDIAQNHLKRIRINETIIKAQPQWADQWHVYEQRTIEREKMSHMQTHVVLHVDNR